MTRRILITLFLGLLSISLGIAVFTVLRSMRTDPVRVGDRLPRVGVRTLIVERQPYEEILTGYGLTRALRRTELVAEVSAVVKWIAPSLEAGGAVAEGEELVRLDPRDLRTAHVSAKAVLRQASASLEARSAERGSIAARLKLVEKEYAASKRELERQEKLEGSNFSASQLDGQVRQTALIERTMVELRFRQEENISEIEKASAEIALREAELAKASYDLERTVIRAPFAGSVVERNVQLGARVDFSTRLCSLVDTTRIEIPVAIAARHFGEIAVGAEAVVRLREGGEVVWQGPVARIAPTINEKDRTFYVFLEVHAASGEASVPTGGFVLAEIRGNRHEGVVVVPRGAFVGERVFVVDRSVADEPGVALIHERHLTVERYLPDVALVSSGLEPGEEIVLTSVDEIDEGSIVRTSDDSIERSSSNDQPEATAAGTKSAGVADS